MGFGWGLRALLCSFGVTLFVAFASPATGALHYVDFNERVEALAKDSIEIAKAISQSKASDRAALLARIQAAKNEIKNDLDPALQSILTTFAKDFQNPTLAYLSQQKSLIENDLKLLLKTSDETRSAIKNDGLQLISGPLVTQVRAFISQEASKGRPQAALQLLEFLTSYLALPKLYLDYSHLERVVSGQKSVTWGAYLSSYQNYEAAKGVLESYFPDLPDFSFGNLATTEMTNNAVKTFARNFTNLNGQISDSHLHWLYRSVNKYQNSQETIEVYRSHFFPKAAAEGQLVQLMTMLSDLPGSDQCFQLAKNVSSPRYDGMTCRPAEFYSRLKRFLSYYSQVSEPALVQELLSLVAEYRNGDLGEGDLGWAELKARAGRIGVHDLQTRLIEPWRIAQKKLLNGETEKRFRKIADSDASGFALWSFLKSFLVDHGIGVRQGPTGWVFSGTIQDFTPDAEAIEVLKLAFEENVLGALKKYRLNEDPAVDKRLGEKVAELEKQKVSLDDAQKNDLRDTALLEVLESRMAVFNSFGEHCPLILDKTKTFDEKVKLSPWVVTTRNFADTDPTAVNSSNGIQRLTYYTNSRIANAVAIQNEERPDYIFAGVAVKTAVSAILPNLVQARMMMQDFQGRFEGDSVTSLGVADDGEKGVLIPAQVKYKFPEYSKIISDSKNEWRKMLARYGERQGLVKLTDEEKRLESAERQKLLVERFEQNEDAIARHFAQSYREEIKAAARLARTYEESIASLRYEPPQDAPDFLDDALGPKGKEFLRHAMPDLDTSVLNINDNIHLWIITLKKTYAASQMPELKGDANAIWAMAHKIPTPQFELSDAEFMEQFRLYGLRLLGGGTAIWRNFMGYDRDLPGFNPQMLLAMYRSVMHTRERRIEYLDYAKNLVLFRFPALRLNKAYLTYDGSEAQYQKVMLAYYQNAQNEATKYQKLGSLIAWDSVKNFFYPIADEKRQSVKIIDAVISNLPLLDIILKNFPDQMKFICEEKERRQITDDFYDKVLASTAGVGATMSFIGLIPGGQVVGLVGLGVSAVASLAQAVRTWRKWAEYDAAQNFAFAASSQQGFEADQRNWDMLREQAKQLDEQILWSVVDVGLTAVSAVGAVASYSKAARLATLSQGRKVTMFQVLKNDMKLFGDGTKALATRTGRTIRAKMVRGKFLAKETSTLKYRFMNMVQAPVAATNELALIEKSSHLLAFGLDEFNHGFWRLFGLRWNNTWRAIGTQFAYDGLFMVPVVAYFSNALADNQASVMEAIAADSADKYQDILTAIEGGWMSQGEMMAALEAHRGYMKDYIERAKASDELLYSLSGEDDISKARMENAKKNIKSVHDELAAHVAKLDPNTGKYFMAKRNLRYLEMTMERWDIK